jgi:photosystem II stability/assembly factor-like uncharacterized protein
MISTERVLALAAAAPVHGKPGPWYCRRMIAQLLLFFALASEAPTWTNQDSGVTTSIRGISAVDGNVCWFGTKAGVARTLDGGKHWIFTKIGADDDGLDFRDLHAISAAECVAMSAGEGRASRIYRTVDGGKTWSRSYQNTEAKGFFNGIAFRNAKQGVLAGDPIAGRLFLLSTEDGGETWKRLAEGKAPEMGEGENSFAASGTHLTVDDHGRIWITSGGKVARVFHSPDWGETWETYGTPMIAGEPSAGIFSITKGSTKLIAVGGDYKKEAEGKDNAMLSDDGGKSWRLITKEDGSAPFPFRSCVGYVDENTLVTVGPSGGEISRDGGNTWQALRGEGGFHTFDIAGGVVWAAGADGQVGRLEF